MTRKSQKIWLISQESSLELYQISRMFLRFFYAIFPSARLDLSYVTFIRFFSENVHPTAFLAMLSEVFSILSGICFRNLSRIFPQSATGISLKINFAIYSGIAQKYVQEFKNWHRNRSRSFRKNFSKQFSEDFLKKFS